MSYQINTEYLKQVRQFMNLSQTQVEEDLKMQPGRLSLLENSRATIKAEEVKALFDWYGIDPIKLLTEDARQRMASDLGQLASILHAKVEFTPRREVCLF